MHYRFRLADGTTTPDAVFATAPARNALAPFTFTAFADQGVNVDNSYEPDDTRRAAAQGRSPGHPVSAQVAVQPLLLLTDRHRRRESPRDPDVRDLAVGVQSHVSQDGPSTRAAAGRLANAA